MLLNKLSSKKYQFTLKLEKHTNSSIQAMLPVQPHSEQLLPHLSLSSESLTRAQLSSKEHGRLTQFLTGFKTLQSQLSLHSLKNTSNPSLAKRKLPYSFWDLNQMHQVTTLKFLNKLLTALRDKFYLFNQVLLKEFKVVLENSLESLTRIFQQFVFLTQLLTWRNTLLKEMLKHLQLINLRLSLMNSKTENCNHS